MTTSRAKKPASRKGAIVQAGLARTLRATLEAAPEGFAEWIREAKARVHAARPRAARAVNTAIDAQVKAPDDEATIGLLLCKTKNELVAEYALRTTAVPLGIADYQLVESLPKDLDANLPSIARIEEELAGESKPKASARTKKRGQAGKRGGRR